MNWSNRTKDYILRTKKSELLQRKGEIEIIVMKNIQRAMEKLITNIVEEREMKTRTTLLIPKKKDN